MRRLNRTLGAAFASFASIALARPALAAVTGESQGADVLQVKPILDARVRYESVDQGALDADAATLRVRAGAEARLGMFSILAEGEGTAVLVDDYNAFPFAIADAQRRPQFATVSDPRSIELNRFQLQYNSKEVAVTLGRQRINLDDQRWVGSVDWRQNEQTFDGVRSEAKFGLADVDLTYAISQRTIFGKEAGPRTAIKGAFIFAGVGSKVGPVQGKVFAYLIDYDETFAVTNSSQTFGGILSGSLPLFRKARMSLRGSYARQSDYGDNPFKYATDYWAIEAATNLAGFSVTGGWEQLGSDNSRSLQTPLATLHKFNGWADLFLTTPPAGLEDTYVSIGATFKNIKALPGLNALLTFHQFDSAVGNLEYGTEWDASAGFKVGKVSFLLKYADYKSKGFGNDTRKLWLQTEWSL